MNLSIIDACFPLTNQSSGLAALWLKWHAERCGANIVPVGDSEICAVTCVDPLNWKICAAIRKRWPHVTVVAGGAGALSPYSIGLHCDAVCVGNGTRFIEELIAKGLEGVIDLPETWVEGQTRMVAVAPGFPWDCPPIEAEDGAYRVWCGRGCKKRCAFCQTGWGMLYSENPNGQVLVKQIKRLHSRGKKVAYLSNDPMQHSFSAMLPAIGHGSYTLDFIRRNGAPKARQIRLGIEGVSERLRRYVFKPISHDDLVKATAWLCEQGKSVRWFMIIGLPTETDDDWAELRDAVTEWKRICPKGVLAISFSAWRPEPATPLGIMPIDDGYWHRWKAFKTWFFDDGGWSNRVKLMNPAQPKSRLKTSLACMGVDEQVLRRGGEWGPNDRVDYPYKKTRNKMASKMFKGLTQ